MEIGADLSGFEHAGALAQWLTLCPGSKTSGGKTLSSRTRKTTSRVSHALRLAARTLHHSQSYLGVFYRRMRARLGAPEANTATAHKLARIIYHLITTGEAYDESVFAREEQKQAVHREKHLRKQARSLGFDLVRAQA